MEPLVQILISTYNGEKYIAEQIDSLLDQSYPNISILIRDDGSTDNTVEILKRYDSDYENITVFIEENVGVTKSFFKLLSNSNAEYIAFCDQDDIWLPEKITKAVKAIENEEGPALYCSNKILVDGDANILPVNPKPTLLPGFDNALVESICTGCTAVLNKALADNIKNNIPTNAVLHDWWVYLVATHIGKVYFDTDSYIYYRQHGNNVVGADGSFMGNTKAKIKYLKKSKGLLRAQLTEFKQLYAPLGNHKKAIDLLLNSETPCGKLPAVFSHLYRRQSSLDQFVTRGLIFINKLL